MALDLPRFVVYLTPIAIVTALLAARLSLEGLPQRRLLGILAVSALAVPAIIVPSLVRLENADKFAAAQHPRAFLLPDLHVLVNGVAGAFVDDRADKL